MAQLGSVTEFDAAVGWGTVMLADGRQLPFHLTQIADGTRTIALGTAVTVDIVAGGMGRWEASALTAVRDDAFPCLVCATVIDGRVGGYEICPTCGWEDDPVQRQDPTCGGGANLESLHDARKSWHRRG